LNCSSMRCTPDQAAPSQAGSVVSITDQAGANGTVNGAPESRSVDELAAKKQLPDLTTSKRQRPLTIMSRAVEALPNNMISHVWMHANAGQRTEFVRAHWIDIMWVRDRLGGAALPSSTPPASNVDAMLADMLVTPETEA